MMASFAQTLNQKLAFAGVLLAQSQSSDQSALSEQACLESACFQLYAAYRLYLRELAYQYALPDQAFESAEQLQQVFFEDQRMSPEVGEVMELLGRRNSWLTTLLLSYGQLFEPSGNETAVISAQDEANANVINAIQLDVKALSAERLKASLSSFHELLQRHRQSMQEC